MRPWVKRTLIVLVVGSGNEHECCEFRIVDHGATCGLDGRRASNPVFEVYTLGRGSHARAGRQEQQGDYHGGGKR